MAAHPAVRPQPGHRASGRFRSSQQGSNKKNKQLPSGGAGLSREAQRSSLCGGRVPGSRGGGSLGVPRAACGTRAGQLSLPREVGHRRFQEVLALSGGVRSWRCPAEGRSWRWEAAAGAGARPWRMRAGDAGLAGVPAFLGCPDPAKNKNLSVRGCRYPSSCNSGCDETCVSLREAPGSSPGA